MGANSGNEGIVLAGAIANFAKATASIQLIWPPLNAARLEKFFYPMGLISRESLGETA